jgi:hypothetical protein
MKVMLFAFNSSFRGARALARANPESRAVAKCLDSGSTPTGPRKARPDDRLRACPGMTEFTDPLAFIKE